VLVGHDVYDGLVQEAGWAVRAYRGWLFSTLVEQLLRARRIDPRTISDLSFARDIPGRNLHDHDGDGALDVSQL